MINLQRANKKVSSLFFKLLISFLLISLLPLSFNFFSYTFFRTNIMDELIENSSSITNTTAKHYEELFRVIKNLEFAHHFKAVSSELSKSNTSGNIDYLAIADTSRELNNLLINTSLHMDNMIIILNNIDFAISKSGSSPLLNIFDTYYYSDSYSYAFWKKELTSLNGFRTYPSAMFTNKVAFDQNASISLMPMMYMETTRRNTAVITFLDNEKMFNSFYPYTVGSRFYILDRNNQVLFDSGSLQSIKETIELPIMDQTSGYEKIGTDYFFYQKGTSSGYTYVNIIPTSYISSQISRLNLILGTILVLSLILSIAASIYISIRLNNPLQKIIESIRELNFSNPPRSQIKEFNIITDKISDLVSANTVIHQDLSRQNSLLKYYAYSNKLKNIQSNIQELNIPLDFDKPFMLIGFHLLFTSRLEQDMDIEQDRAANFFKEFINADLSASLSESLTFQTEHDVILSLVFVDGDSRRIIEGHLQQWKRVFDLDREYCLVSIAVGDTYYNKTKFADAYKRIVHLLEGRRPGDQTQVIPEAEWQHRPRFDNDEDHIFQANLKMGNTSELFQIVKRKLSHMDRKKAALRQMHQYAEGVIRKVCKAAGKETSDQTIRLINECYTLEQLEGFFEIFLDEEVGGIRQKKEELDPIIDFVTEYVNNHIGDDISLDLLADKLNITGAYLSTYFKSKKKVNFSEYVNNLRMKKAQELLETTDLKVQDIASQVGYYSVNAFIRTFKKYTGIPPGEFRKVKIIE